MKISRIWIAVFLGITFLTLSAKVNKNEIVKVLHHKGGQQFFVGKNEQQLTMKNMELGNVVFYFSGKPIVNFLPARRKGKINNNLVTKVFIFPHAHIKDARMVNFINDDTKSNKNYNLCIEKIELPIKGVKLSLTYDPNNVMFDYKFFESISKFKGVVFSFYNKNLVDKLKITDDSILRTVESQIPRPVGRGAEVSRKKKTVIVDCGHGGADVGATGCFGIKEKDVNLAIGLRVASLLKKRGFDVCLTRSTDTLLQLNKRTALANKTNGDAIFLSIHANSSANDRVMGIETFCMQDALFKKGLFFCDASDENRYIQYVSTQVNTRYAKSVLLAAKVHKYVYDFAKCFNSATKDRKLKHAVSQVLLGAHMPAAMIEVGFLSNKQEAAFLNSERYQQSIARGICKGVVEYFRKI